MLIQTIVLGVMVLGILVLGILVLGPSLDLGLTYKLEPKFGS